ncbi:MAG: energy transducer TonB [Sphingobacteriales bacterium]
MLKTLWIITFSAIMFTANGQPAFKGGQGALYTFISQKIVYPEYSRQNCISGTVKVSFVVDKNGNVTNARVSEGLGIDLDDEALRVIKLTSGKWIMPVRYNPVTIIVPIRFEANQTICGIYDQVNTGQAIIAYKNRQLLEDEVTNYYKAKYEGKTDTIHEAEIINLKKLLGFDDKFINDMLEQAGEKFQQGDIDGACHDWTFIKNIGSNQADQMLSKYCK